MRLINVDIEEENGDGHIIFEFEGYVYYIGQLDGPPGWFSRQSVEDYENRRDNWEKVIGWMPENIEIFKLLRGKDISQ